jgi:hypothetical protein
MRLRPILVIVACALAACTSSPSASPEDSAQPSTAEPSVAASVEPSLAIPSGWERHEVGDYRFALSLPEHWGAVDLTAEDMAGTLEEMYEEFPNSSDYREVIEAGLEQGLAFIALDFDPAHIDEPFITNVNVLALEGEVLLPVVVAGNVESIESTFGVTPEQESVSLPAGDAVILRWDYPDSHSLAQYYLVEGGMVYVVSFSRELGEDTRNQEALFEEIMNTFEVVP